MLKQKNILISLAFRVISALFIFLIVIKLFSPAFGVMDSLTFDNSHLYRNVHYGRYLAHQSGLNANKGYLLNNYGNSVTRNSPDDIGVFIWQANLKLLKKLFTPGSSTLSYIDVKNIHLFFIGIFFVSIILLRFDISSTFISVIILLIGNGMVSYNSAVSPNFVCVAISSILLLWLCVSANRMKTTYWDYLSLFLLSTLGGIIGTFRAGGSMIIKFPFFLIFMLLTIVLLIINFTHIIQSFKKSLCLIKKPFKFFFLFWRNILIFSKKENSQPSIARTFILTLAILLGVGVAAPCLQFLNLTIYSIHDQTMHYPIMGGRHTKWGPLYAGLGETGYHGPDIDWTKNISYNGENVYWSDSFVRLSTSKETGSFKGWNQQYEDASRKSYLRILFNNTSFVIRLYIYRLKIFLIRFQEIVLFSLAGILALVMIAFKRERIKPVTGIIWLTGGVSIISTACLPLLGNIGHYASFITAVAAIGLFSFIFAFQVNHINESFPKKDVLIFSHVVRWFLMIIMLMGVFIMCRVFFIEHKRHTLMIGLKNGNITLNKLFSEYPVDADYAFNYLEVKDRIRIAQSVIGKDKKIRKAFLNVHTDDVVFVAYRSDTIFALINVKKRFEKGRVYPIEIKFKENNYNMTTDLMAMPARVEPGIWLMSFRLPKKHVNGAIIKPPKLFKNSLYETPKEVK